MIQFDSFMQAEGVPIYQQIIRYVKQGIAAGTIRDGEELPSRRVLSAWPQLLAPVWDSTSPSSSIMR